MSFEQTLRIMSLLVGAVIVLVTTVLWFRSTNEEGYLPYVMVLTGFLLMAFALTGVLPVNT